MSCYQYVRDTGQRLTRVRKGELAGIPMDWMTYAYTGARLTARTDADGRVVSYGGYDALDRPTQITVSDATAHGGLVAYTINWDTGVPAGQLSSIDDPWGSAVNHALKFTYDPYARSRVTCGGHFREQPAAQSTSMTYDLQGQLIRKVFASGITADYAYDMGVLGNETITHPGGSGPIVNYAFTYVQNPDWPYADSMSLTRRTPAGAARFSKTWDRSISPTQVKAVNYSVSGLPTERSFTYLNNGMLSRQGRYRED